MEFITNYWAQITLILSTAGYILKSVFDYLIKNKELRFRYFYETKANKIIEIHSKIVELQIIIDRGKKGDTPSFENNILKHRVALDKYYWESSFYLSRNSENAFKRFLEWLKFFELKEMISEDPEIKEQFLKITTILTTEFKKEII